METEAGPRQVAIARCDHADHENADEHEKRGLIRQQPERGARVLDVIQTQPVAEQLDWLTTAQAVLSKTLRELVRGDDQPCNADAQQRAPWKRAAPRRPSLDRVD